MRIEAIIKDEAMAKWAYLYEMHKHPKIKHEDYMETQNKRPGPPLANTDAYKSELNERENFNMMEKSWKKFNLTSNWLNLDLVEWGNMLSVYSIKNDSNKLFFIS